MQMQLQLCTTSAGFLLHLVEGRVLVFPLYYFLLDVDWDTHLSAGDFGAAGA